LHYIVHYHVVRAGTVDELQFIIIQHAGLQVDILNI